MTQADSAGVTIVDIQPLQNAHSAHRGIGRYLSELVRALGRWHPGTIGQYLLNPDLPVPDAVEPVAAGMNVAFSDGEVAESGRVYHIPSPFEPAPIHRVWPPTVRDLRLVVTLHDLIPFVVTDLYLLDPRERRWYNTRLDLLQRADRVIAVSQATANDAVERAGIAEDRVTVIGEAPAERFRPPVDRDAVFSALREELPAVRPGYLFYQGGMDYRKNINGLLYAYAAIAPELRRSHQLVVACGLTKAHRAEVERRLDELGIRDAAYFPGYVSDETLVRLYQAAALSVFPSFYEGFGLPIVEAMACGTPVIAAASSSLVELVADDEALFDPYDPREIRDAITRALTDEALLARLRAKRIDDRYTWRRVAEQTAELYSEVARLPDRPRRRTRLAFVGPLPPQPSPAADHNAGLVSALAEICEVDAFVEHVDTTEPPPNVRVRPLARFGAADGARGGYDGVLYSLANNELHVGALATLLRRSGTVLAHDIDVSALYKAATRRAPELGLGTFSDLVRSLYGDRVPQALADRGADDPRAVAAEGLLLARHTIERAERFLVHSRYAEQFARLEAPRGHQDKVERVPFAYPAQEMSLGGDGGRPLVASVALHEPAHGLAKLVDALAELAADFDVELAVVGAVDSRAAFRTLRRAAELGVGDRLRLLEPLDRNALQSWLQRATVAVQLRDFATAAATPGPVAHCIAAGVPTIVTATGALRELPDTAVVKLSTDAGAEELAAAVAELLRDPERRASLRRAARAHAGESSFARVAADVHRRLGFVDNAASEVVEPEAPAPESEPQPEPVPSDRAAAALAALLDRPLRIVDVGSRWGVDDRWWAFEPYVEIIGFEPDEQECERLREAYRDRPARFVPVALAGASGSAELVVTEDAGSSSLFHPDLEVADARPQLERLRPVDRVTVEVTTLDRWTADERIAGVDALKLDVQGSELAILNGARRVLGSLRLIEAEVEFNPMYAEQPLFGDVDAFLRAHGFVLWRLKHLVHYGLAEETSDFGLVDEQVFDDRPAHFEAQGGQLFWGHAYFLPRALAFGTARQDWQQWVRDACLLSAFGFRDLARHALRRAAWTSPAERTPTILRALDAY